jgi:cold shock CspA family protein
MWNADRGFGLIGDDSGGPDIFLQYQRPSISRLRSRRHQEGRAVAFDVENTCDGKTVAGRLKAKSRDHSHRSCVPGQSRAEDD